MQPTPRKTVAGKLKEKNIKEDLPSSSKRGQDEKLKKNSIASSSSRNYLPGSSTSDIYVQKKKTLNTSNSKAPKKISVTSKINSDISPMKDYLKSSASSLSQVSVRNSKNESSSPRTKLVKPKFTNVTVNSPMVKRKLLLGQETNTSLSDTVLIHDRSNVKTDKILTKTRDLNKSHQDQQTKNDKNLNKNYIRNESKDTEGDVRQRSKTRTLNENEIKVLKSDPIDNNVEMLNLTKKLTANPKSFYVSLDDMKPQANKEELSEEENVSYEDDFESYESDFDSYHSDQKSTSSHDDIKNDEDIPNRRENFINLEESQKNSKDEEKMLDSGSYDLRERRSAQKTATTMENIIEGSEAVEDGKTSLTDEGFQEMSNNSEVFSMKTIDSLERPLFIDFQKSKQSRRMRKLFDRMKQRAADILSIVSLHEMSYNLFEMKPIPYDLLMTTYGKVNYIQTTVQTFEDGVSEETQTDEVVYEHKWTQHPVEFSKHNVCVDNKTHSKEIDGTTENIMLSKFSLILNGSRVNDTSVDHLVDKDYLSNPLRIYFEQKNGVGKAETLSYEIYKSKLKYNNFNVIKLQKFLRKVENKITHILNLGANNDDPSDLIPASNYTFSKGYNAIHQKYITNERLRFLRFAKISLLIYSDTKNNLLLTVHKKSSDGYTAEKCVVCVWDVGVRADEPMKILVAIENIVLGKLRGDTNGIFVGALDDGTIQLWDLSDEPVWRSEAPNNATENLLEAIDADEMTRFEMDREWNSKNRHVRNIQHLENHALHTCAYTSSAKSLQENESVSKVVGLEFVGESQHSVAVNDGRKIIGQVCSLQQDGIITFWNIVQERSKLKSDDTGKAFWSKTKLEKVQRVVLADYIDVSVMDLIDDEDDVSGFNLNAAKRRVLNRRKEKIVRPTSLSSSSSRISRLDSVASGRNESATIKVSNTWENGLVCDDLKIMNINNISYYLIAKNSAEVLICKKDGVRFKIDTLCVSKGASSVTCLCVSPHGLPYYLAATDCGTIHLCSVLDSKVLHTLDFRIAPTDELQNETRSSESIVALNHTLDDSIISQSKVSVKHIAWSETNACSIVSLSRGGQLRGWDLIHSDIRPRCAGESVVTMAASDRSMALLTSDGEVQIHQLMRDRARGEHSELFKRYVALL